MTARLPYFLITEKAIDLKKSLVGICKILTVFLNTLTADDKYSVPKRDNLREPIEMLLSEKQKAFSQFFLTFLKFRLNFQRFPKRDSPHS